ncbi:methyl-accepting chemotaxis protein [Thermogutta sp.]|uniref:methyl-accepting chemotaxis protein n=1 Tax=Thermogutta sp. TaxID=1962930 RepID=UPI003C7DC9CC
MLIGFIVVLMVTVSSVGWYALATLDRALQDVAEHQVPSLIEHKINPLINEQLGSLMTGELPEVAGRYESITLMLNADRDMYQALVAEKEALAASTAEAWEKAKQASEENIAQAEERVKKALKKFDSPTLRELSQKFEYAFQAWKSATSEVVAKAARPEQKDAASELSAATSARHFDEARHILDVMQDEQQAQIEQVLKAVGDRHSIIAAHQREIQSAAAQTESNSRQIREQARNTLFLFLGSVCAGGLLCLGGVLYLIRRTLRQISTTTELLRDIAEGEGDLTRRLPADMRDEFGELATWFNRFIDRLEALVANVVESGHQFAEGSQIVATRSQDIAAGAQHQVEAIESVTRSVETLSQLIQEIQQKAVEAAAQARATDQLAHTGAQSVEKSMESMELIRASANQISEIIGVISDIASQTNLLALNAAIEAARAGEHGMGFAVVADEVRKLAERCNRAASQITTLIKESTERIVEGAQLSEQVGGALQKIVAAVESTSQMISEIAAVTQQQTAIAQQVVQAIGSVAAITQEASAGTSELASCSEELGAQATALRSLVGRFKTRGELLNQS